MSAAPRPPDRVLTVASRMISHFRVRSQPALPFDCCQLHNSSSEDPSSDLSNSGEPVRVQYGRLSWPPDNDHSRCFVGLHQLDRERVGCADLAVARGVTLDIGIPARIQLGSQAPREVRTPGGHSYGAVLVGLGHHPLCVPLCVRTAGYGETLEVTTTVAGPRFTLGRVSASTGKHGRECPSHDLG